MEINTVEDLKAKESELIKYLCCKWFRFVDGRKIRGRENQLKPHPIWAEVVNQFEVRFGNIEKTNMLVRKKNLVDDPDLLAIRGIGYFTSLLAQQCRLSQKQKINQEEYLLLMRELLFENLDKQANKSFRQFEKKVTAK
jgi:hypothetical protein